MEEEGERERGRSRRGMRCAGSYRWRPDRPPISAFPKSENCALLNADLVQYFPTNESNFKTDVTTNANNAQL